MRLCHAAASMSEKIDTDYLIVGAGAAGMAFADILLTHTDANITIVDRRHTPGGHWVEAYPFVRLHQPSAFYGVESTPLGQDVRDEHGSNAGFYELASGDEIRAYYEHVMHRVFLPTGRVRYLPSCDYLGAGSVRSRLSSKTFEVAASRKVIDTTYLEGSFPGSTPPPYEIADGVRWVPAGGIATVAEVPDSYTIIGAGKTALDTCVWLIEQRVDPDSIRWIKPREAWWINRRFQQPHDLLPDAYRSFATQLEAIAGASSLKDLFARLEEEGYFLRVDPDVEATMFRGAIVSEGELELLRSIKNVVRLGHVQLIESDQIVLEGGTIPTGPDTLHVHCASRGLSWRRPRPIFEPGLLTVQPFIWAFSCFEFSLLAVIEALLEDDDQKNQLCQPISFWATEADYLSVLLTTMIHDQARRSYPEVAAWARASRLNPLGGLSRFKDDPQVIAAREVIGQYGMAAAMRIPELLASSGAAPARESVEAAG